MVEVGGSERRLYICTTLVKTTVESVEWTDRVDGFEKTQADDPSELFVVFFVVERTKEGELRGQAGQ